MIESNSIVNYLYFRHAFSSLFVHDLHRCVIIFIVTLPSFCVSRSQGKLRYLVNKSFFESFNNQLARFCLLLIFLKIQLLRLQQCSTAFHSSQKLKTEALLGRGPPVGFDHLSEKLSLLISSVERLRFVLRIISLSAFSNDDTITTI